MNTATGLAYGGGYYDRYLEKHPGSVHIALAFEFQVFPEVPFEAHDILPQMTGDRNSG